MYRFAREISAGLSVTPVVCMPDKVPAVALLIEPSQGEKVGDVGFTR